MAHLAKIDAQGDFAVPRSQILAGRLTDDGTPLGNFNIVGDYSVTPGVFFVAVPPGQSWYIKTISVYVAGPGNVTANSYGTIPSLTNGVLVQFEDSVEAPLIPPPPVVIKSNGDYQSIGFSQDTQDTGAGVNHVTFTQRFDASFGSPVVLTTSQRVAFRPNDDLQALTQHVVVISGHWLEVP
jgi:hypothetical protein